MVLVQGATGRDEREWVDPARLDLDRRMSRTPSFGRGAHICLGAHLARPEGRIMPEELPARFTEDEVVEGGVWCARIRPT